MISFSGNSYANPNAGTISVPIQMISINILFKGKGNKNRSYDEKGII